MLGKRGQEEKMDGEKNGDENGVELKPYKRRKIVVTLIKGNDGMYEVDEDFEKQLLHS